VSGCGCGQPVIFNNPAASQRLDIEGSLLCDVLPDGTVAGQALVEAVYDTGSGDRVGTRTVNPSTGAVYTPQGTLQPCPPPDSCTCETLLLCDTATVTTPGETPERITAGDFPDAAATNAAWTRTGGAGWVNPDGPDGVPGFLNFSGADTPPGSISQTVTVTPGISYAFSAHFGTWNGGGSHQQTGRIEIFDGAGTLLFTQDVAPTIGASGIIWPADGIVGPVNVAATDDTMRVLITDTSADPGQTDLIVDNISLLGPGVPGETTTTTTPFLRTICRACTGTATVTDTTLDGTTTYDVQGDVGVCGPTETGCASPTTPVTSVGLCLADGTPIAVTAIRDCDGAVTSEGWLNLITGAWTAGAVPAGTVACGDSRSIQVSGTFCDVLPDGTVAGLVLVEYSYDDTGAISAVRLVDAVTGGTYVPTGTVTTCPAGVEQPEQDAVILCDVQADGTSVQFVRDYRRDELGAIVGHTDYLLDGTLYPAPTGTVGVCQPQACQDCESQILCDGQADDAATIRGANLTTGMMSNGTTWSSFNGASNAPIPSKISNTYGAWWGDPNSFPHVQVSPYKITFDRPTVAEFSVFFIYNASNPNSNVMELPPGVTPVYLPPGWSFDPATSRVTVGPDHGLTVAEQTTLMASPDLAHSPRFRTLAPVTEFTTTWLGARYAFQGAFRTSWMGSVSTVASVSFLRTICRDCDGTVTTVRDTTLDGSADYTPSGVVGLCPSTTSCDDCETIVLCDDGGDDPAVIRTANASQQTLSNGVAWTMRGEAPNPNSFVRSKFANADGAWWGNGEPAPHPVGTSYTMGFSTPVIAEFSIHLAFDDTPGTTGNCVQLPLTVEPVELPTGYAFDATTGRLCVTAEQDQTYICADMANPTQLRAARFRTIGLTTSVAVDWLGTATHDVCAVPRTLWLGAIQVTPPGQFMRRLCRDCEGTVTSVVDTLLDGTTSYTLRGSAKLCQPQPCCEPVQICVTPRATGEVQFVSNPDKRDDGTVADTFTWAPSDGGSDPSAVTTWYPMYNKKYPGTAWQTVDSATRNNGQPNSPTAGWIAPHAGAMVVSTGLPGEGPPIANPSNWWARSSFTIPAAADLSTVKMEITALNADQVPVRYRINNGDWVDGGGFYSTATPYRQAPVPLTGAVAGENFLYFEVNENASQPDASNGAGVIAHFILTYAVPGQASWTKMVCCSGDVYYLDQDENRHESLPDGARIIPCTQEQPVTLCDDNGTFIRWVQDLDGTIVTRDTDLNGATYTPEGEVALCAGEGSTTASGRQLVERCGCSDEDGDGIAETRYVELWSVDPDGGGTPLLVGTYIDGDFTMPLTPAAPMDCPGDDSAPGASTTLTGARSVTGTAPQDLAAEFPGIQSVTLIVHSGTALVTLTSGTDVPFPAGVSGTWSTGGDGLMDAASFEGADAGTSYLLLWTFTA